MKNKKNVCPICGFDGLKEPPYDEKDQPSYEVCVCCGFEFGFDETDKEDKYNSYRKKWIADGAQWFIPKFKPANWNLEQQLKNITP